MDRSILILAFTASFMGGLLVASCVSSWIAGLLRFFKPPTPADGSRRSGLAVVPLLLHSGPWVLAIAVACVYYAATSPRAAYLWAVVGGLSLAIALVGAATLLGLLRRRRSESAPRALTPERLLAIRRRFFWINSLLFAFGLPALFAFQSPHLFGNDNGFLVIVFAASFAGGWLWSWFMWQWYGAVLQANDKARQRRERDNAV